ncbi:MAG: DUF58 domain-containing protein [Gammaproteobacteria bacterium]
MFAWPRRARAKAPPPGAASARSAPGEADRLLRRLEWTVIRRLDGLLQGDYRTLFRGMGLDLADLREYQPHDDVRHIDWNVTARMQAPYVREFQEDREVAAWFLTDLSASVDFGSGPVKKRTLATEFCAVLARVLTRHGNRVGAMIYRHGVEGVVPAGVGRRHVLRLLDAMRPPAGPRRVGTETELGALLAAGHAMLKRRSAVFVVSDFVGAPGWEHALGLLARRHEVVAVRLFDPLEHALPDLGLVVMEDAETGEQIFVDARDRAFRRRFADAARAREVALREAFATAGVDCLELSTAEPLDAALVRFLRLRKRRSQLAAGGVPRASDGAPRVAGD